MSAIRKPLPKPPNPLERWNILSVAQLSESLPPIPWVCHSLRLAPGAVTLVAGYGYSGKTMALQSLGLSVASGKRAWGVWDVRKGPFVHLDYEQGRRLTQERYQRLARGMGFELLDLDPGSLRVGVMPRAYLDEDKIFDELCALVGDAAFVLVDSLRAAFPRADENSSEVRTYLDVLSRVSERTGAAIAVIHHARKPSANDGADVTHAIRGSSALFDACQSVYVFLGSKDVPTIVHHQKDRVQGSTLEDFGLGREDVPGPTGPNHGLRVTHLEGEQIEQAASQRADAKEAAVVEKVCERIIETIGPSGFRGTRTELRGAVRAKNEVFSIAITKLGSAGFLRREGSYREPIWQLSVPSSQVVPERFPEPRNEVVPGSLLPREGTISSWGEEHEVVPDGPALEERGNLFRSSNGIG